MKTKDEILHDMITDVVAESEEITYFGKDGNVRGILNAATNVLVEIWNDVYQQKRALQITTAEGTDLDARAERKGLTRLGATKSSCVLLISGPAETVIPAGTIVKSTVNPSAQYQTLENITLGYTNENIVRPLNAESIGDIVIAESITAGSRTNVVAKELTQFLTPIGGVTVTNLTPSVGGTDAETDGQLRDRILSQFDLLSQGTQAFYEAIAKEVNPDIIKANAIKGDSGETEIYVVKNSFALFTDVALAELADSIYEGQRAFNNVVCKNAGVKSIEVNCYLYLRSGYTFDTVFADVASAIANYVEQQFAFGATIKYQDILNIILDLDAVTGMDTTRFLINGGTDDVVCLGTEVPRFTYLKIDSGTISQETEVEQKYLVV